MKPNAISSLVLPVALGLSILAAGCKGEEKAKPPPPPPPRPVERPQAVAPEPPPPPPPRKERAPGKVVKSVTTAQGKLNIVKYGKGGATEYGVTLGDRTLVEPDQRPVEVAAAQPKAKANLVLLRFPRKDKQCPARFRVADLTRGRDPRVSEEFGNCSARPRVSSSKGGWKLAFPKAGSAKAKTWTYAGGELREPGQGKSSPAGPTFTGPQ